MTICGDSCSTWVAVGTTTNFTAEIEIVPHAEGPLLPVAAILTDSAGQPHVRLADGSLLPIQVLQAANGLAIVDGVTNGTQILLPADG